MKTNESTSSFANAKSRVPLAEIDIRGVEATKKLARVFSASTGRSTRAATFSSAL
ncbi:FXSXX-COOH protein [Streptomyces sp. LN785]|uniref:FXSXX-COOH protein n=1 Tax=Streptomyces sp. LN785 TaxID=3112983 RepID=UPI003715E4E6